jgi:hypothetical protein
MPSPEIEEFAKTLVRAVRDEAIRSSDRRLRGQVGGPVAKRWTRSRDHDCSQPPPRLRTSGSTASGSYLR